MKDIPTSASKHKSAIERNVLDVDMNNDSSIAACRTPRVRRLPARFIINHTDMMDEGGEILSSILQSDDEELEVDIEVMDFLKLIQCLVDAEVAFINVALTDPIDDPNEKDPSTLQEAKSLIYWTYWLAAIYEELESLKAKGVYNEVNKLPSGRKAVKSKWVLHIKRNCD